jgi:hypothetical protein
MSWNPFRRHRPTGRHARPVYPTVPGAAATLVAVAAAAAGSTAPPAQADAEPVAAPLEAPVAPVALASPPSPELVVSPARAGAVSLGFADGQAVELAADDPRAESLRAAAAALLDHGAR